MKKMKKQTILAIVFVAIGLLATGGLALAQDTFTINATENLGLQGSRFVPSVFFGTAGAGGGTPCEANGAETGAFQSNGFLAGNCTNHANAALEAWFTGGFYDPRRGTAFIPPSGDHHRSGYRLMMQPSFSAGSWLTGFAFLANEFPFFPSVGTAGAGMDPDSITLFLDAHGEPLTTGKFPRYWPHERQTWSDTLMVKYVASAEGGGLGFSQSFRSQVGQSRTNQTWLSMTNENAGGCSGGYCKWVYDVGGDGIAGTADDVLTKQQAGPDGVLNSGDDTTTTVTSSRRIDTIFAMGNSGRIFNAGADGTFGDESDPGPDGTLGNSDDDPFGADDGFFAMRGIEKTPTIIDDRLMQADNDLAGCAFDNSVGDITGYVPSSAYPGVGGSCASVIGPGGDGTFGTSDDAVSVRDEAGQALHIQFQVVSGPNFHSEEGADPYSWVVCGSRGSSFGEEDCNTGTNYAFLDPSGSGVGALAWSERVGPDGLMFTSDDGLGVDGLKATSDDTVVLCDGAAGASTDALGPIWTADCDSSPAVNGTYGAGSGDTIYYREALENGLRGGIRETVGHAFSFASYHGCQSTNDDPECSENTIRQLMTQDVEGFLVSCLNCGHPAVPAPPTLPPYNFIFPASPGSSPIDHPPPASGSISLVP
jgi:hypothetical protein